MAQTYICNDVFNPREDGLHLWSVADLLHHVDGLVQQLAVDVDDGHVDVVTHGVCTADGADGVHRVDGEHPGHGGLHTRVHLKGADVF